MPSKSEKQRNYIFYLRGKYKSKENTPEDQKWIWESGWETVEELYQKINIKPYKRLFENIDIDLNSGDTFKFGKFKNKIAIYKSHYINEKGDLIIVTDTGKEIPAMKIRLSNGE